MARSHYLRILGVAAVVVIVSAAGLHVYALSQYHASFPPGATEVRHAAVRRALSLEPWNVTFAAREAYVHAEALLGRGDLEAGYQLLHASVYRWPDDRDLDRLYREVYPEWYEWSALKAHAQHGHEGPGGTLRPQDIER